MAAKSQPPEGRPQPPGRRDLNAVPGATLTDKVQQTADSTTDSSAVQATRSNVERRLGCTMLAPWNMPRGLAHSPETLPRKVVCRFIVAVSLFPVRY
jgi:hypothetical protein